MRSRGNRYRSGAVMRILYFHQHFSTRAGAAGTRSYEFARRLVDRGHHVTMVCGSYGVGRTGLDGPFVNGQRRGVVDGIEVIEFELPYANSDSFLKRTATFLRFAARSIKVALAPNYDLVFATSTPLTVAIPGIVARILRRRTFVFEVRDLWPELPRAMGVIRNPVVLAGMSLLEFCAYRLADGCIGLAPGIVEGIRRRAPRTPVAMISNGSDLSGEGASELPAHLNELLRSLDGKLKCIFAGAHGIANGLDAVLDAAVELRHRQRDDIHLIFIGDGMMKPKLMRRAHAEGLHNCTFLDPVPKRALANFLREMDVGLMILADVPAFYNGTSPNKFFDYIAAGIPVLINYPGWLAQLVTEEGCGVVVRPGDPVEFADALERLTDWNVRRGMGEKARRVAEAKFHRDSLALQFIDFLEGVAGGKAPV
jgi:Glycosyltransferase